VDAEPAHDIPFGVINTPHDRPFFPASWVDVADESGGLAYFHRGTPKHWVSNGELVNLFAWGEDTEAIGSRMWRYNWPVAFDQRLQGAHRIDYAVLPHDGDWRAARVPAHARDYGATTLLGHTGRHAGRLPLARTSLALDGEALNATSVRATDGAYVVRCVNTGLEATAAQLVAGEPSANAANPVAVETRLITGEQVEHIAPFKIAHVTVRPAS
jgi:alpha-mannosidase